MNTLLSNILKNAVEASQGWIMLKIKVKGNLLAVECRNSCDRQKL
ncbi:hypothetical protein [Holdemania sp. 1001302B_160321_E10]